MSSRNKNTEYSFRAN